MKKFLIALLITLTACQNADIKQNFPKSPSDAREERIGSLTGDDGLVLSGKRRKNEAVGITVNSYLWRSSLEAISDFPIQIVDPFSGIITTDWKAVNSHEKYKINVLITSDFLRADAIKVNVFKQRIVGNSWQEVEPNKALAREIEDRILTRARQLKIAAN